MFFFNNIRGRGLVIVASVERLRASLQVLVPVKVIGRTPHPVIVVYEEYKRTRM